MSNVRVNTVMDSELLEQVDSYAKGLREDRSTAIRQLVAFALHEQRARAGTERVRRGQMTLREFAADLGVDLWAAHDLLASAGVPLGTGVLEETAGSLDELTMLLTQE